MIYFLLILFFGSLVSIVLMVSRKLVLIKNGKIQVPADASFEIPYVKEVKDLGIIHAKKLEHKGLVAIVKSYVQISSFAKNKFRQTKTKVKNVHIRNFHGAELKEKAQNSKIFKVVSNYKHRIKTIKEKVKEEENNL